MSFPTELKRIVRRLENSSNRRIARRNALRDLDTLLKRIRRELRTQYPTIGKDGQELQPALLPKGARKCPADGTYLPTPGDFARHVLQHHQGTCWCGFKPKEMNSFAESTFTKHRRQTASLRAHFNRVRNQLQAHFTMGALGQSQMAMIDSRATYPGACNYGQTTHGGGI